ncbi:hypothetical protein [Streptomyces goshikiensis]|uniref:hypothetical protein n=1 Tax=Streptomyces goshikiensis TaxID=1942 RepID=UPI00332EE178
MTDAPAGRSAAYTILTTGYTGSTGPGVAATVSYVSDAGRHLIFDPGMVASLPSLRLIRTPGHSPEDITLLAGTDSGVVAFAGDLWWHADGPADDPVAPDRDLLRASRERVLAAADLIVPGHGGPFTPTGTTPR